MHVAARDFRVLEPDEVTATVTYVSRAAIEEWRVKEDAIESPIVRNPRRMRLNTASYVLKSSRSSNGTILPI